MGHWRRPAALTVGRAGCGKAYADGSNPSVRKDLGVRIPSPALVLRSGPATRARRRAAPRPALAAVLRTLRTAANARPTRTRRRTPPSPLRSFSAGRPGGRLRLPRPLGLRRRVAPGVSRRARLRPISRAPPRTTARTGSGSLHPVSLLAPGRPGARSGRGCEDCAARCPVPWGGARRLPPGSSQLAPLTRTPLGTLPAPRTPSRALHPLSLLAPGRPGARSGRGCEELGCLRRGGGGRVSWGRRGRCRGPYGRRSSGRRGSRPSRGRT